MFGRLLIFTVILTPGWINLVAYWLFDSHVIKNVEYTSHGAKNRNLLDIYLPYNFHKVVTSMSDDSQAGDTYSSSADGGHGRHKTGDGTSSPPSASSVGGAPVVIFVSGGAWIIGYKLWSSMIARGLSYAGCIVVVPDYRNFPQGDIESMIADVKAATKYTLENIYKFGGDREKLVLAGQSAGAHIVMCLMLDLFTSANNNQAEADRSSVDTKYVSGTGLDLSDIKLVMGISGPYNLQALGHHLHRRGLDSSILEWICRSDILKYSPTLAFQNIIDMRKSSTKHVKPLKCFPPLALLHGKKDQTIPSDICVEFASTMQAGGVPVTVQLFSESNHTDAILEGPLSGDDTVLWSILDTIEEAFGPISPVSGTAIKDSSLRRHESAPPMVPAWLVKIARRANPF
jgi:prenylcysteine alpha-carboxyl methylesterase